MASFAVLGAAGNVGRSLTQVLTQQHDVSVRALVRSKAKVLHIFPDLDNDTSFRKCINGTQAAFLAVALTNNQPGCTIAQDTAKCVIAAEKRIRQNAQSCKLPRLVILSSASISEYLNRDVPKVFHTIMLMAASYMYNDLEKAEEFLRAQEHRGVKSVFVKPGGLVHDAQKGHQLSTERQQTFLSDLDLVAGMVEVAEAEDGFGDVKDVSLVLTANDVKIEWWVLLFLVKGLLLH